MTETDIRPSAIPWKRYCTRVRKDSKGTAVVTYEEVEKVQKSRRRARAPANPGLDGVGDEDAGASIAHTGAPAPTPTPAAAPTPFVAATQAHSTARKSNKQSNKQTGPPPRRNIAGRGPKSTASKSSAQHPRVAASAPQPPTHAHAHAHAHAQSHTHAHTALSSLPSFPGLFGSTAAATTKIVPKKPAPATSTVPKQTVRNVRTEHTNRARRTDGAAAASSSASAATSVATHKSPASKKIPGRARANKSLQGKNSKSPIRPARNIVRSEASSNPTKRKRAKEISQSPTKTSSKRAKKASQSPKKASSTRTKQGRSTKLQTPPRNKGAAGAGAQAGVGTPPSTTRRRQSRVPHIDWDPSALQVSDKVLARYSAEDPLYYPGTVKTVLLRKKDKEQEYKIHFDDGSNKTNVSEPLHFDLHIIR